MVMHARKIPRLNDGCNERNQAHPYEEKYPSRSHSSGYGDYSSRRGRDTRDSPTSYGGRSRDDSPVRQRYHNKSSYMERARIDKGSSSSPADRRSNHFNSSYSRSGDSDRSGNHVGKVSSTKEVSKDPKDIQKSAVQVSGDWSEHISSSGKKYYYNYKTEVSQWETPKDWVEPTPLKSTVGDPNRNRESKNGRDPSRAFASHTPSKGSDGRYKHSSGSDFRGDDRTASRSSSYSRTDSSHDERRQTVRDESSSNQRPALSHHKTWHGRDSREMDSSRERDRENYRGRGDVPPMSRSSSDSLDRSHGRSRDEHSRTSSRDYYTHSSYNGSRSGEVTPRNENEDSRQTEDMDISPGSTPTHSRSNSRPSSRQGTPGHNSTTSMSMTMGTPTSASHNQSGSASALGACSALPGLIANFTNPQQQINNRDLTQQAIQTLQKLQEALLANQIHHHQHQQQQQTQVLHNATSQSPNKSSSSEMMSPTPIVEQQQIQQQQQQQYPPPQVQQPTLTSPQINNHTMVTNSTKPESSDEDLTSPKAEKSVTLTKKKKVPTATLR